MTNPAILEALTAKMEEIWNDDLSFADQAAAVLELVGPKPLVWVQVGSVLPRVVYKSGPYNAWPDGTWRKIGVTGGAAINPTLEAAQAAAEAHHIAAYWAQSKIGGE